MIKRINIKVTVSFLTSLITKKLAKMDHKMFETFLIGAFLVIHIEAQTTVSSAQNRTQLDFNSIAAKNKQFQHDLHDMRTSGNFSSSQLIADIQAIVKTAQESKVDVPPQVQTQIKDLQNIVAAGKPNINQLIAMFAGVKEEIMQEIVIARG